MIRVGDTVSWQVWTSSAPDRQRGTVTEVRPDGVVVEYGPWGDGMFVPADKLAGLAVEGRDAP